MGLCCQCYRQEREPIYGREHTCVYIWCKKIGEGAAAHFEFLTPEEEAIKRSIISKYYGDTTEQGMVRSD